MGNASAIAPRLYNQRILTLYTAYSNQCSPVWQLDHQYSTSATLPLVHRPQLPLTTGVVSSSKKNSSVLALYHQRLPPSYRNCVHFLPFIGCVILRVPGFSSSPVSSKNLSFVLPLVHTYFTCM